MIWRELGGQCPYQVQRREARCGAVGVGPPRRPNRKDRSALCASLDAIAAAAAAKAAAEAAAAAVVVRKAFYAFYSIPCNCAINHVGRAMIEN